jgi:hypothetical protein
LSIRQILQPSAARLALAPVKRRDRSEARALSQPPPISYAVCVLHSLIVCARDSKVNCESGNEEAALLRRLGAGGERLVIRLNCESVRIRILEA